MSDFIFTSSLLAALTLLLLTCFIVGRLIGKHQLQSNTKHKLIVVRVAEAAIFTLLGLMIAFTFSNAYDKFQMREMSIIDEGNAISAAYSRIDLLKPEYQPGLRKLFQKYITARLNDNTYHGEFDLHSIYYEETETLQNEIWKQAIAAIKATNNHAASLLVIESINKIIDNARYRHGISQIYPPFMIYVFLMTLAMLGTLMIGYATCRVSPQNLLYTYIYLAMTILTIYLIIDLDHPRIGLIKINSFDDPLVDANEIINSKSQQ